MEDKIVEYKKIIEEANKMSSRIADIQTEIRVKNQQALDILKSYDYKSLSDIGKLRDDLKNLEAEIVKEKEEAEQYIKECSSIIEKVEEVTINS